MDLTSWIVWAILVVEVTALVFIGFWFSLRTLRWFAGATAIILAIAVARFGLTHPEYTRANLVDSFLSGADQVTIALLHPLWPGKVPAPGVAGRWIIAVALLLGYRLLERWALHWQAPELDLSAIGRGRPSTALATPPVAAHGHSPATMAGGPTAGQRQAQLAAELRFRLPTMEVRSPSILPGGTRTNALASIAETSGVSGAGLVSAVLRFAGMFWPSPRLVRVRSWVECAAGSQITVLLEDVKTGLPIATNTVAGESFNEATSMVAGYIARQIFAMDRTVPEWCYGTADGRDLAAMQLARLKRVYAACPKDIIDSRNDQIDILSSSTGTDRAAGVVRYELAQLLALRRQALESLRLHALNRELHSRFYRGRYRLAMSLEMIANPEHYLPNDKATWDNLQETLDILYRSGLTDEPLKVSGEYLTNNGTWKEVTPPSGDEAPCMRASRDLVLQMLQIAAKDLGEARTQLSAWRVVRDGIFRRDERAVWLPHWRRGYRQPFHDGVCVAELLIAVRCRLLEPDGEDHLRWLRRARIRWHLRRAIRITSFIAGDPALINAVLTDPHSEWWATIAAKGALGPPYRAPGRDHVRRLPRQRSTASWQAAYNTACLYAALADAARKECAPELVLQNLEHRVIVSLQRAVDNPHSELERPSDWIDSDPDFHAMHDDPQIFKAFESFLLDQMRQDYPDSFIAGKCPVPHTTPGTNLAVPGRRLKRAQFPIRSPVPGPVPTGDDGTHENRERVWPTKKPSPEATAAASTR
jgi:hypothetical protein